MAAGISAVVRFFCRDHVGPINTKEPHPLIVVLTDWTRRRRTEPVPHPTMLNAAKDALASMAAQTWANSLIARYGKVQTVKIDSRRKTLEVSCLLDGEPSPITIKIENYVVETERDKKYIRATNFSCTRLWLQNVLTDFGPKQKIELPPWAAAVL